VPQISAELTLPALQPGTSPRRFDHSIEPQQKQKKEADLA